MNYECQIWAVWAKKLHRWGLHEWVATLFEAAGPFVILSAQVAHISRPFLGSLMPGEDLDALINLLEEPDEAQAFLHYLKKVNVT